MQSIASPTASLLRRLWYRFVGLLSVAELPDRNDTATRLTVDRRCLTSRPFDGCPRRRAEDITLHIVERRGAGCAWTTRDGSRASVDAFDWRHPDRPVDGFIVIERHPGMTVRLAARWSLSGAFQGGRRPHNWDLVSVETGDPA